MIKDIVKDAFEEGREVGGEWEDSESKIVSEMFAFFDLTNTTIRQRSLAGKFGRTFRGISEVRKYFENELNTTFNERNFKTSLYSGWKFSGFKWEVVV